MLRFEPDIRNDLVNLAPAVPPWIGSLSLEGIPLMGGLLSIRVEVEDCEILESPEGLSVVDTPRQATF